jgi:hypothetical protein
MGVNHFAHPVFVKLFLPALLRTADLPNSDVRIVTVTSEAFTVAPGKTIAFDNLRTTQSGLFRLRAEQAPEPPLWGRARAQVSNAHIRLRPPRRRKNQGICAFEFRCQNNLLRVGSFLDDDTGPGYRDAGLCCDDGQDEDRERRVLQASRYLAGRLWKWTNEELEIYSGSDRS